MERITLRVRTTKKTGDVPLMFRLRDTDGVDIYYKSDISADVRQIDKLQLDGTIEKVLQNLLEEKVSIRNYVKILETMANYASVSHNSWDLTAKVREALGKQICMQYADPGDKKLRVMRLSQELSEMIAEHAYYPQDGAKPYVAFDPVDRRKWITAVSNSLSHFH